MSFFAFVVCILALEGVVVVVSQAQTCSGVRCKYDSDCGVNEQCLPTRCGPAVCTVTLTCANVLCNINTNCRIVASCNGTKCTQQPNCIPIGEVKDGIDNECRRRSYTEVVLTQNPRNQSAYIILTCSRYRSCPSGSDCVGGLCCRGKVPVPLTKPGLCPTNKAQSECIGKSCTNDYACPGEQKCCSRCRKVCTDPIFVQNTDACANTRCGRGEVCVLRTPFCREGMLCLQALLPVCVPRQCQYCNNDEYCAQTSNGYACSKTDQCGGCPRGKVCKPAPKMCITTPCEQYACVPIDRCGGCPVGEVCKRNSCLTDSCGSYKCYPETP